MNPHQKETHYISYLEEKVGLNDEWHDVEMGVEVGGLGLIICTISISTWNSCNVGFRIVDENNTPLLPYREKNNTRHPTHFTLEPEVSSVENMIPATFHMVANCQYARLQVRPSDGLGDNHGGAIIVNHMQNNSGIPDADWSHKAISTMTAIPLAPNYQGGANTILSYPQPRVGLVEKKTGIKTPTSSLR